jgi:hypothetical protein
MNKNVLKMWTNRVNNPSIHFFKYIKGCEWSFNSSSYSFFICFWSIITNPTWQAIGSLQVKVIGKGCKSFTYSTPWTHDLFEVSRSQNDLCQWTITLGEFLFILSCSYFVLGLGISLNVIKLCHNKLMCPSDYEYIYKSKHTWFWLMNSIKQGL